MASYLELLEGVCSTGTERGEYIDFTEIVYIRIMPFIDG